MTSQGYYGINEHAGRETETPHGFPTRFAAAISILLALSFVEATPQMAFDPVSPRPEQYVPSACGAEAVARAQRELDPDRPRPPSPTALS